MEIMLSWRMRAKSLFPGRRRIKNSTDIILCILVGYTNASIEILWEIVLKRFVTLPPPIGHSLELSDIKLTYPNVFVKIIRKAVSGMLPKNKLRDRRLERLRIYEGDEIGDNLEGNLTRRWGLLRSSKQEASEGATAVTGSTDQTKRIIESRPLLLASRLSKRLKSPGTATSQTEAPQETASR